MTDNIDRSLWSRQNEKWPDPYIAAAAIFYRKPHCEITAEERQAARVKLEGLGFLYRGPMHNNCEILPFAKNRYKRAPSAESC